MSELRESVFRSKNVHESGSRVLLHTGTYVSNNAQLPDPSINRQGRTFSRAALVVRCDRRPGSPTV